MHLINTLKFNASFGSDVKGIEFKFLLSFHKTQTYLQEAQVMVEDASIMIYQQVAKQGKTQFILI
jgi:hypothetical protein